MRLFWKITTVKRSKLALCLLFLTFAFFFHSWFISYKGGYQIIQPTHLEIPRLGQHFSTPLITQARTTKINRAPCINMRCNGSEIPYKVISGDKLDQHPFVCIDEQTIDLIKDEHTKGRGLHLIRINVITKEILNDQLFDTYNNDYPLIKFLKTVPNHFIIVIVCYDECSAKLTKFGKEILSKYGSVLINDLQYRENFIMIGQLGLQKGLAIEKIGRKKNAKDKDGFGAKIEISGCLKSPVGQLIPNFVLESDKIKETKDIRIVQSSVNTSCGECSIDNSDHDRSPNIPVHIYIGKGDKDFVRMCINGIYYFDKKLNGGGRGLNIAHIDEKSKGVVRLGHFDTYNEDSSSLEIFLESLQVGDTIIVASFDDASSKLTNHAKKLFFELGSSMVQNLKYRGSWYFVGQKGIQGFSSIEDLEFPDAHGSWAPTIDVKFCLPLQNFQGIIIKPDPSLADNVKRRDYCAKYGDFADFCDDEHIYEYIAPAPLIKPGHAFHPIYNTPILVVAGISHTSLRMTLETLIMQPGIKPSMIMVAYDELMPVFKDLTELFGARPHPISSSFHYNELFHKALQQAWDYYSKEEYLMIIEQNLVLAPDYIHYMSQALIVLINSSDLASVSAWNPYGHEKISDTRPDIIYRMNEGPIFPGLAFILKRSFYEKRMKGKMQECCHKQTWQGWLKDEEILQNGIETLIPDYSRVYRLDVSLSEDSITSILKTNPKYWENRAINLDPFAWAELDHLLDSESYDDHIKNSIKTSKHIMMYSNETIKNTLIKLCEELNSQALSSLDVSIILERNFEGPKFSKIISRIVSCYQVKIFVSPPLPSYKGLFRFTYYGKQRFILKANSQFL